MYEQTWTDRRVGGNSAIDIGLRISCNELLRGPGHHCAVYTATSKRKMRGELDVIFLNLTFNTVVYLWTINKLRRYYEAVLYWCYSFRNTLFIPI